MGNELEGVKVIDIQKKEIQQRPLNHLSPFNYTAHSTQRMSHPNVPSIKSHAPVPIAVKRKSLSNMYIANASSVLTLSPIVSDPPPPPPISTKTVQCASDFWIKHIESLSMELRLEIGWSIYIGMLVSRHEIQKLFGKLKTIKQIESTSLKFLDMVGFLIRGMRNQSNAESVHKSLQKLGSLHANIGVTLKHYGVMIQQMHQTFEIYFHETYHTQVRWCVHKLLAHCVRLMTDEDLKMPTESLYDTLYLQSLDACLASEIGRQKLFRYLQKSQSNQIVIFLHLHSKFKIANAEMRYMIVRYIMKACVDAEGSLSIENTTYKKIMQELEDFETNCNQHHDFTLVSKCFVQMERSVHQLIMQKDWTKFKKMNM